MPDIVTSSFAEATEDIFSVAYGRRPGSCILTRNSVTGYAGHIGEVAQLARAQHSHC